MANFNPLRTPVQGMLVCALAALLATAAARVHTLSISNDARWINNIETFGFVAGGAMELSLTKYKVTPPPGPSEAPDVVSGFVLLQVGSEQELLEDVDAVAYSGLCLLALGKERNVVFTKRMFANDSGTAEVKFKVEDAGLYSLLHTVCSPAGARVAYHLDYGFVNPGPNYLSVGDQPLPSLLTGFSVCFAVALVAWWAFICRRKEQATRVHYLMGVLLLFKTLSLVFETAMFSYVARVGHTNGWSVLYDIATFVKGTMLFTVIVLLGTGWSSLKPYLSDRERKILLIVLPLQVIENIAYVVLSELTPGDASFVSWTNLFHLIDIVCCCIVLLPILWSIHHLRQAAAADGKVRDTLARLEQFRKFYLVVITYVYFTRIVVAVLGAVLSYTLAWVSTLMIEAATLALYTWTGYKFRPLAAVAYAGVPTDEEGGAQAEADDAK